jgi:hypothetical protein
MRSVRRFSKGCTAGRSGTPHTACRAGRRPNAGASATTPSCDAPGELDRNTEFLATDSGTHKGRQHIFTDLKADIDVDQHQHPFESLRLAFNTSQHCVWLVLHGCK